MDSIIISSIIVVSGALIYKIGVLCYASKCKILKCSCRDGLDIQRDVSREPSIRHLDETHIDIGVSKT
jgi:hypothetical protein